MLQESDVYLVHDRYRDFITKSAARLSRGSVSRGHVLTLNMPLIPKDTLLKK